MKPYLSIAHEIRQRVRSGVLRPNERLGSQNELAVEFRVSPATVQKSLKELEREGIIWAQQGKGRFVADPGRRTRTWTIGVVLFDLAHLVHPVIGQRLAGIRGVIGQAGYHLSAFAMNVNGEAVNRWLESINSSRIDGAIVIAQEPDVRTIRRLACNVPSVWMDAPFVEERLVCVSLDYLGGGFAAGRHLIELGHRRIGFLGPELDRYRVASEQHEGARLAVEQLGGPAAVLVHLETADYTESAAKTTFGRAVSGGDYPTALIAASDELARGAWAACQEAEIVIPRDLSLVAWNDTIALNEIPLPLTTVRMDFR
jgi:DNA-binding LacI/PurR family transcriptional regulator